MLSSDTQSIITYNNWRNDCLKKEFSVCSDFITPRINALTGFDKGKYFLKIRVHIITLLICLFHVH